MEASEIAAALAGWKPFSWCAGSATKDGSYADRSGVQVTYTGRSVVPINDTSLMLRFSEHLHAPARSPAAVTRS